MKDRFAVLLAFTLALGVFSSGCSLTVPVKVKAHSASRTAGAPTTYRLVSRAVSDADKAQALLHAYQVRLALESRGYRSAGFSEPPDIIVEFEGGLLPYGLKLTRAVEYPAMPWSTEGNRTMWKYLFISGYPFSNGDSGERRELWSVQAATLRGSNKLDFYVPALAEAAVEFIGHSTEDVEDHRVHIDVTLAEAVLR